ncbi:MAG: EVE domain-containing protein [Acidobacteriota bacterium]|nr:EVE domain-containing protein [Acidobacteriota bacterium]
MARARHYWLVKSEPAKYSIDDLAAEAGRRACWDGVRNYQARNFMRDGMRLGDQVLFYHSAVQPPGVAGCARVVREAYPDPTQFDPASPAYDPRSRPEDPRWLMVDLELTCRFDRLIPLAELRATPGLEEMLLLRRGQRLSVMPVTPAQWRIILGLARPAPGSTLPPV